MKLDNAIATCLKHCSSTPVDNFPYRSAHGASLITKNGSVVASGKNHYRTHCSYAGMWRPEMGKLACHTCSFHAEIEVIRKYFALKAREQRKCKLHGPTQ